MEILCILALIAFVVMAVIRSGEVPVTTMDIAQMRARREAIIRSESCATCDAGWPGLKLMHTPPICRLCDLKRGCGTCKKVVCAYDCATPRCGKCGIVGQGVGLVPHPEIPHFGETYRCASCRPQEDA